MSLVSIAPDAIKEKPRSGLLDRGRSPGHPRAIVSSLRRLSYSVDSRQHELEGTMTSSPRMQLTIIVIALCLARAASGDIYEVTFPPSTNAKDLTIGVTHTLWDRA